MTAKALHALIWKIIFHPLICLITAPWVSHIQWQLKTSGRISMKWRRGWRHVHANTSALNTNTTAVRCGGAAFTAYAHAFWCVAIETRAGEHPVDERLTSHPTTHLQQRSRNRSEGQLIHLAWWFHLFWEHMHCKTNTHSTDSSTQIHTVFVRSSSKKPSTTVTYSFSDARPPHLILVTYTQSVCACLCTQYKIAMCTTSNGRTWKFF